MSNEPPPSGSDYQPTDRRPIASRERAVFKRVAAILVSRGVTANAISIFGMISAIVAGVALFLTSHWLSGARALFVMAAIGIQLRLIANMLDGMVAIASSKASRVGELYNEMPDRVADAAVLIGAGYAIGGEPTLGWLAAVMAVFVAYVRALGKAAGAHNEFCGPMAKQHRMVAIIVTCLVMAVIPSSITPAWVLPSWLGGRTVSLMALALAIIIVGCVATAVRRTIRIAHALKS